MSENNFITCELFNEICKSEVSGDFILPDNMSDARSILNVRTTLCGKDEELNDTRLEYETQINYDVLYLTEEGEIGRLQYTSQLKDSVTVKEADGGEVVLVDYLMPNTVARLSNPRRLSIKTKLPVHIRIYGQCDITPSIMPCGDAEKQTFKAENLGFVCIGENGIGVSEDIVIPGEGDISKITAYYADPVVNELRASEGRVIFKGDIYFTVLYEEDGGEMRAYTRKLPVSHICQGEGVGENDECVGDICVYDVSCELSEDEKKRTLEVDMVYDVRIRCIKNTPLELVSDMYSLTRLCNCEYKTIRLKRPCRVARSNISISERVHTDEQIEKIYCISSYVDGCEATYSNSKAICTGRVVFECVGVREGKLEKMNFAVPYRIECDNVTDSQNYQHLIECRTCGGGAAIDGDNVYLNAELYICIESYEAYQATVLSSFSCGEETDDVYLPLTLYYPTKSDSLWSIAKKYRTRVEDIISANALKATDISEREVIVIPKR